MTWNIEGVKNNMDYFQKLCANSEMSCLQEHWLYEFQNHELSQYVSEKDTSDSSDPLLAFNFYGPSSGPVR